MITKLTLTIEEKVIKSAKMYVQKRGGRLYKWVGNYL